MMKMSTHWSHFELLPYKSADTFSMVLPTHLSTVYTVCLKKIEPHTHCVYTASVKHSVLVHSSHVD